MEGRHVDVIEMDAASHTGIDDIREIIEQVRYRPVSARYKVYIIDEVHMLSTAAFNGLLKTLEEPPSTSSSSLPPLKSARFQSRSCRAVSDSTCAVSAPAIWSDCFRPFCQKKASKPKARRWR